MIPAWMLGSTVFAALLCVAAFASERVLRMTGRPTRSPWAIALVLAIVWPLLAPLVLTAKHAESGMPLAITAGEWSPATAIAASLPTRTEIWEQRAATLLLVVWAVMSALMLMRLVFAARELSRVTRTAKPIQLDGEPVLVTESLGPAVVGLWTPRVAVPEWFMQLDGSLREMVLRHEREHCKSRDPQLVWLASLAVAIMPWNFGVWMLSRRLRLALEIDCDARTLRRDADSTKYGKLLLLIAQRQSSYPLASMLAESSSHLSRRITAMQMTPLRKPAVQVALFSAVAAGALVVACSPRVASDLTGPGTKPVSATAAKLEAEKMAAGTVYFESQVEVPVSGAPGSAGPIYPAELMASGVEGSVLAMFVVDETGAPQPATLKILRTDKPEFEAAVRTALPNMRFTAAKIGGKPVRQLVQQPFSFALSRKAPTNGAVMDTRNQRDGKLTAERGTATIKPGSTPVASNGENAPTRKPLPQTVDGPYFESQVEKPVGYAPGSKGPEYPAALRSSKVEGTVLAMFVVNEDGLADMSSFKVLRAANPEFEAAVRKSVSEARFTPALVGGRPVKQIVQQPFSFAVSK